MASERFRRIEGEDIRAGMVRKQPEKDRFSHLETGEDARTLPEQPEVLQKKYFPCPFCGRNNRVGNLYCIYCGQVFPQVAEKTEGNLAPYEIICPQCGRKANVNQKICLWCGFHFVATEEDILKEGPPVEIEIGGQKYSSRDPYLPAHIRQVLAKIKQEGSNPEKVQQIINEMKIKQAEMGLKLEREVEKRKYSAIAAALLFSGGLLMFIFRIILMTAKGAISGWLLVLAVVAGLLIIAGMATLALGIDPNQFSRWGSFH